MIYIDDVAEFNESKNGKVLRLILMFILIFGSIAILVSAFLKKSENEELILQNDLAISKLNSDINALESEQSQKVIDNEQYLDNDYFYPHRAGDAVAAIQNNFSIGETYVTDEEVNRRINQYTKEMQNSYIEKQEADFIGPWFTNQRIKYKWSFLSRLASTAGQTPVIWQCTDSSNNKTGYVIMVVTGIYDGKTSTFSNMRSYVTSYGESLLNGGKTINQAQIDTYDIQKTVADASLNIDLQPVADAIADGVTFTSETEIAELAEQPRQQTKAVIQ